MCLVSGPNQSYNSQGAFALPPKKGVTTPLTAEEVIYLNLVCVNCLYLVYFIFKDQLSTKYERIYMLCENSFVNFKMESCF